MTKYYKFLLPVLLLLGIAEAGMDIGVGARDWNAILIPSSNENKTIRLVGGHTQMLTLALQAEDSIRKQGDAHEIGLEWDFPQDMELISNDGVFKQVALTFRRERGRNYFSHRFRVSNANLLGKPGERINSDWRHHSFFVSVPSAISEKNAYIVLTLRDKNRTYNWRWPLRVSPFNPANVQPKITTLGLWDYGFYRAGAASEGIAAFFQSVGINFVQRASDEVFSDALKKRNILVGGYTHHSAFASASTLNSRVSGEPLSGQFACPQASLELSSNTSVAGVGQLIKNALQRSGMAVIDYEPNGLDGFCDAAVRQFKKDYAISAEQFESFRRYFAEHKLQTFNASDAGIRAIYAKWQQFNSQQTRTYIKQIREAVRKAYPEARLGITTGRSYSGNLKSVSALGNDNSMLADNADVIMPQLYFGYNGANVKLLMNYTQGWRDTLEARKAKAQLWPLLLIRYPGLNEDQPPLRMRQQVLGALAFGAHGVVIYAPSNMEAEHWITLADTAKDIAAYEHFYQQGQRADASFTLRGMPNQQAIQTVWPHYKEIIDGPDWAFTAHEWQDQYLLTFFNLDEKRDFDFKFDPFPKARLKQAKGATKKNDFEWTVRAGQIGFVIFSKQP